MRSCRDRPLRALLVLLAWTAPGSADSARAWEARLSPVPSPHYRPGAWVRLDAEIETTGLAPASYHPALDVIEEGTVRFSDRAAPFSVEPTPGIVSRTFWILAGENPPAFRLRLEPAGTKAGLTEKRFPPGLLSPLNAETLHVLAAGGPLPGIAGARVIRPVRLPIREEGFASVDLVILGNDSSPSPGGEEIAALAGWILRGGGAIALDTALAENLERAAAARGWRLGPPHPFVLPGQPEPPVARRLGRGLLVRLDGSRSAARRILGGHAAWTKLVRDRPPRPARDLRLAPARYERLGLDWPPPPAPGRLLLLRWLLAWACLGGVAAWSVRRRAWGPPLALLAVSIGLGSLLAFRYPPAAARIVRMQAAYPGALGPGAPASRKDLWFVTPFADAPAEGIAVPFDGFPPPRPLAADRGELRGLRATVTRTMTGGLLRLRDADAAPVLRRGVPLLLSRTGLGGTMRPPGRLCIAGASSATIEQGARDAPILYDVSLQTARARYAAPRLEGGRGVLDRMYGEARPGSGEARRRALDLLLDETRPGRHAVLAGWLDAAPGEDDLGTLVVTGILRAPGP